MSHAQVAPSPRSSGVFLKAKLAMAEAAATFDGSYPISELDSHCLRAGHKLEIDFDNAQVEEYKFGNKGNASLVQGEVGRTSDQHIITRVSATIRAPANDCLGYLRCHHQEYQDVLKDDDPDVLDDFGADYTPRSHFYINRFKTPAPLSDREYVCRCAWEKRRDGTIFFTAISAEHPDYPLSPDFVRMSVARAVRLIPVSPGLTKIEVTSEVDLGGSIPRAVNDAIVIPLIAGTPMNMMNYFACVRSSDAYDVGASRELGTLAFCKLHPLQRHPEELRAAVHKMVTRNDVMREFQAKYNFLQEIIFTIMRNKITQVFDESDKSDIEKSDTADAEDSLAVVATAGETSAGNNAGSSGMMLTALKKISSKISSSKVPTTAQALTSSDATRIASAFSLLLLSNITSDGAVDEWILSFPALKELDWEFHWFRPMMESIAASLLSETSLGVKLRAYSGAAMSVLDMLSDIYVVNDMMNEDRGSLALALFIMVLLNIAIQLAIVWVQNRKAKKKSTWMVLKEVFYVLTFVKPGVDARRVATGQEQEAGAAVAPLVEMVYSRSGELVAEAIPGMILQCVAFVTSKKKNKMAVVSILISAGCAALTATCLAYDMDTNPKKRRMDATSWGMIPNTGRATAFCYMFTIAALQSVAKCTSIALLAATNPTWLLHYLVGDMLLYLVIKAMRRDFIMVIPLPLGAAIAASLLMRISEKIIVDATGCMLFRLPYQMGGACFMSNAVLNLASVPVIAYLYLVYAEDTEEKMGANVVWIFAACMVVLLVVISGDFMARIVVPKFRKTFWSLRTGRQLSESMFLDNTEDDLRVNIFTDNIMLWSRIEEDVREWTMENWERWDQEKPAWFTGVVIASVPDDFIPPKFLARMGGARQRRGSAVKDFHRPSVYGQGGSVVAVAGLTDTTMRDVETGAVAIVG
jgi:hypothetical protein